MAGQDATFIYTETDRAPFVIASLMILEPREHGGSRLDRMRRQLETRLELGPHMRQRVQRVPWDLHHPVWVDDPDFDIKHHVLARHLPAPGTRAQLDDLVAELIATPFDTARPLWELYVIDGLEDGRSANLIKTHHAAVDGLSGFQVLTTLVDIDREPAADPEPTGWTPGSQPGAVQLTLDAARQWVSEPLAVTRSLARLGADLLRSLAPTGASVTDVIGASMAPPGPFNATLSEHRAIRFFEIDLAEARALSTATGAKINDIALAVIGGGLRRHLARIGFEAPQSLVTYLPITLRREGDEASGNNTSVMAAELGTDIADPLERLELIAERTRRAKERAATVSTPVILDLAAYTGPPLGALLERVAVAMRTVETFRLAGNLVVSNVASVPFTLYSQGARIEEMYPIGPITNGVGLNFTLLSYEGKIAFSMLCDSARLAEPDSVVGDVLEAWRELRDAAGSRDRGGDEDRLT